MMEQIQDFNMLSHRLAAQLQPGVMTNTVLSKETYLQEIRAGTLYTESFEGGLLLLRRRDTHQLLNFFIQRGASMPEFQPEYPTVLEIATRARDTALRALEPCWAAMGFQPFLSRQRMVRNAGTPVLPGSFSCSPHTASPAELPEIYGLMETCFDPLTGCLPLKEALREDLTKGYVFSVEGGLLHIAKTAAGTELRHLAVSEPLRRQGAAQSLFEAYMIHTENQASRVWVRQDNQPALRFYEKNGYQCDGWTSVVYLSRKDVSK